MSEESLAYLRSFKWYIATYQHNSEYAYMTRSDHTGAFTFSGHSSALMAQVKVQANTYVISVKMTYDEAQEEMKKYKLLEFPWMATEKNHTAFSIEAARRMKERRENKQDIFDAEWVSDWMNAHPLTEWENRFYEAAHTEVQRTQTVLTLEWLIDWLEANPKSG